MDSVIWIHLPLALADKTPKNNAPFVKTIYMKKKSLDVAYFYNG